MGKSIPRISTTAKDQCIQHFGTPQRRVQWPLSAALRVCRRVAPGRAKTKGVVRLLTSPFHPRNGFGIIRIMSTPLIHKVTLKLCAEDLAHVRFAFSPLWECVAAFRAWADPSRHALLLPWMTRVRQRLSGVDWEPLASLASVSRGTIPDFLSPPPSTPLPRFREEIAGLRRTPAHVVRAEIEIAFPRGVPRGLRSAVDDPKAFLLRVTALLEEFWDRALAPDWPLLRSKLEAEVLFRSRALALGNL